VYKVSIAIGISAIMFDAAYGTGDQEVKRN
jgi:hypothetical protein